MLDESRGMSRRHEVLIFSKSNYCYNYSADKDLTTYMSTPLHVYLYHGYKKNMIFQTIILSALTRVWVVAVGMGRMWGGDIA